MRRALLLGVCFALLANGAAIAAAPVPDEGVASFYDEGAGVSATVHGPVVSFAFINRSRRAIRAFRGRYVRVGCEQVPSQRLFDPAPKQSKLRRVKVGKHATKLRARIPNLAKYDLCTAYATIGERFVAVSVATTVNGAILLKEAQIAADISGALDLVYNLSSGGRAPSTDVGVARLGTLLVALADPGATPAAGKIGYWSDGDQHLVIAAQSPSGRRLFFESEANGVVRDNITPLLVYALIAD